MWVARDELWVKRRRQAVIGHANGLSPTTNDATRTCKIQLEEAGTHKSAKPTLEKTQRPVASERGDVTREKPDIARIVCAVGHYSRENRAWLAYAAVVIMRSV